MAFNPFASSFSMAKLPSWPFGLWAVIATAMSPFGPGIRPNWRAR